MHLPEIEARTFPGKRVEAYRAGITPKILRGTADHTTKNAMIDLRKKLGTTMPLSHRKLFQISAILATLVTLVWAADGPSSDAKISIEPRAKPQASRTAPTPRANIRVDTTMVLIPVTVTDPLNRFVTGLERENFKLSEDKIEQKIQQFSSEDAPLSVGLVFDTSGSMGNKMEKSRQAVAEFLKTMNTEDESFLVEFNDRAELALGFTKSPEEIQNKLTFTQSKGRTALLDAVYLALHTMKKKAANSRKA